LSTSPPTLTPHHCVRIERRLKSLQHLVDRPGMPGGAQAAQAAIDLIKAQRFALARPAILSSLSASASTAPAIWEARAAMALPTSSPVVARIGTVCAAIV
jgi:hypothetical protein